MSRRIRNDENQSAEIQTTAAVVWIDAGPLLKVEKAKLRSTKKKLSEAEDRVRMHKESDEPDYQRWFNETFSERLAELRELYEKLAHLDSIVSRVEREILATGCSAAEAYERAVRDEAAPAPEEDTDNGGESTSENDDSESDIGGDRGGSETSEEIWKPKTKRKASGDEEMKQVYRQLVRRLHPDLNPDLPEHLKERWFEVQQAYEDRDLARLESLLTMCEEGASDDEAFIDKIQSLSRLRLLLKSVAKKLKASKRQLAQLKMAPAWEFHKTKRDPYRLERLRRDVVFELRGTEDALARDIHVLELQIKKWQAPPRKRDRRDWNLSFED